LLDEPPFPALVMAFAVSQCRLAAGAKLEPPAKEPSSVALQIRRRLEKFSALCLYTSSDFQAGTVIIRKYHFANRKGAKP
jgi:hypothetical protein